MKLHLPSFLHKMLSAVLSVLTCGVIMPTHAADEQRTSARIRTLSTGINWVLFRQAAEATMNSEEGSEILQQAEISPVYSAAVSRLEEQISGIQEKADALRHA
ncbi:MAG: hypothetical protein MJ051_02460 [Akkermansia sp.]|nr:hypothetical protein [Akkermansia sp.]